MSYNQSNVMAFWDFESQVQAHNFTRVNAPKIIKIASKFFNLTRKYILDFGSGNGYLAQKLLERNNVVYAVDSSTKPLERLSDDDALYVAQNIKMMKADSVDIIFCVEVIEHIEQGEFAEILCSFDHILRPGGYLFITTRYKEDLRKSTILCPCCGEKFHRWLHLRTFDKDSIRKEIETPTSIKQAFCGVLDLQYFERIETWNRPLRQIARMGFITLLRVIDFLFNQNFSLKWHCRNDSGNRIIWIGQKVMR
jgi:2-polyprenyl-3-methyl-5-hydroxy-6-metoxy-1,4-benzoquinol methylase